MKVLQIHQHNVPAPADAAAQWSDLAALGPQLVLVFAAAEHMANPALAASLAAAFPDSLRIGCSTAGEIAGDDVDDHSLVLTAIRFAQA